MFHKSLVIVNLPGKYNWLREGFNYVQIKKQASFQTEMLTIEKGRSPSLSPKCGLANLTA